MCTGSANSDATIKSNTTPEQDKASRAKAVHVDPTGASKTPTGTANSYIDQANQLQGFDIAPPPDSPDITDKLVRQRRAAAASQLMLGRGRAQSFSQGDMGDLNLGQKKLLGGG